MITIAYDILFRVTVRHAFYTEGVSPDFSFRPTPTCRKLLDRYGLVFKPSPHGFTVFARVQPGTDPPELYIPIDDPSPRFAFLMQLQNPYFLSFTQFHQNVLPTPGLNILYFSNVQMLHSEHPRLEDRLSMSPGTYPVLLRRNTYNLQYTNDQNSSSPNLEDPFGFSYGPMPSIDLAGADTTRELQIDFKKIERIRPGRYYLTNVDTDPDVPLYYEPQLNGEEAFGVIEIFNDTSAITSPPDDQVAVDYKFLNGNLLSRSAGAVNADYTVHFEPGSYELRYIVRLKPETIAAGLLTTTGLSIQDNLGGTTFSAVASTDSVVFTSDTQLTWSQTPHEFELRHAGARLKILPNPTVFHPVKRAVNTPGDPADDILYYEIFIYV